MLPNKKAVKLSLTILPTVLQSSLFVIISQGQRLEMKFYFKFFLTKAHTVSPSGTDTRLFNDKLAFVYYQSLVACSLRQ